MAKRPDLTTVDPTMASETGNSEQAASRMPEALAWLAVASVTGFVVTPLVINRHAYYDAYFSPKWAWMATMTALGLAAMLGRALFGKPVRFVLHPVCAAALAFVVLHYASALWAPSPTLAVQRALHLTWLTAALGLVPQVIGRRRRGIMRLAWAWIGVAVATAIWTLYQDFIRAFWPERLGIVANLPDWRGYLSAGLGNTNHIGDLLALALLLDLVVLGQARRAGARAAALIAAVILAAALTVVYSVGSNLGLFIGGAIMLGMVWQRERGRFFRRRGRWVTLGVAWAAMLGFFLTDVPGNPHRPGLLKVGFASERWAEGGPTRLVIWAGGAEIVRNNPILGVGAGNFTYVYPEMKSPLLEGRADVARYQGQWTNAAHNVFLQTWSEVGVIGLVVLLWMLGAAFASLLKEITLARVGEFYIRMTLMAMLAAWLAHAMMNFALQQPSGAIALYLLLAAVVIEERSRKGRPRTPPLVSQSGPLTWRVDFVEMDRRPDSFGVALPVSRGVATAAAALLIVAALLAAAQFWRPVRAHNAYTVAHQSRLLKEQALAADNYVLASQAASDEERMLELTLALDPWATGARSRFSEFLIEQRRPSDALAQLEQVRRRLNSSELYHREARALAQLGRNKEAEEKMAAFRERFQQSNKTAASP